MNTSQGPVEDAPEPEVAEIDDAPEVAAEPEVGTVPEAVADLSGGDDDIVKVTMFETIDPPPVVGNYHVSRELSVSRLEAKKSYRLPRFVALVIVDAQKGAIAE